MRHRPRPWLLPLGVALACALALPATASATGATGLHIDPASPVAKAYALPLGNVGAASSGRGHTSTLFGAGITRTISARATAYRLAKPKPGVGLALMGLIALVVVVFAAAGAVALSRRR